MTKPEVKTAHVLLEAMIDRVLKPNAALKEQVRQLGYDMDRPVPHYPGTVSRACFDFAAKSISPNVPRAEAERIMGRAIGRAYLDTLIGKVLRPMMELAGPRRALPRTPSVFGTGFSGVESKMEEIAPGHWRMTTQRFPVPAEGMVGTLEVGLALTGAKSPRVEIERDVGDIQVFRLLYDASK